MLVREIAEKDRLEQNKKAAHIVQSWEWGQFRLLTPSVPKLLRLGFFENNTLLRFYQIYFHKTPFLNRLIAYIPKTPVPIGKDLETITEVCKKERAVFIKFEPENPMDLPTGDSILPKHNLIVDLTPSEEEILSKMHEKTRYNIKLAQKSGVIVLEKDGPDSLETFIKLYDSTQKRQGFFAKSGEYIRTLWETLRPNKMVYLLMAQVDDKPVAGGMFFNFNGVFSFPYGGWSAESREKMPNNLLHFEAMKLGKKLGCHTYDFWSSYKNKPDASDPWYGTYVFKKGFGGQEVHYPGAYDLVLDKPIYSLIKLGNKIRWPIYRLKRWI
ncbi:MAG: peptidoglycan bridge formation glycyltransferase FemA/FemB family protein [Patescibacteria group bacterium]